MVLGILSCVLAVPGFCCCLFGGAGVVTGITAVILGFVGRGQNPSSGTAKTGIITGFAGIGLSIAVVLVNIILGFVL
jgi:hypothetical protein